MLMFYQQLQLSQQHFNKVSLAHEEEKLGVLINKAVMTIFLSFNHFLRFETEIDDTSLEKLSLIWKKDF